MRTYMHMHTHAHAVTIPFSMSQSARTNTFESIDRFDFHTIRRGGFCIVFLFVMRTLFGSSLPSPNLLITRRVVV